MTRGAPVVTLGLLLLQPLVTDAGELLQLRVRPPFGFAPQDVEVKLHVEPGGRARQVELELDGDEFYRASRFPIRRDVTAPTVQPPAWYRSVPAGDYVVRATLTDTRCDGCRGRVVLARRERPLQVVGR